MQVFIDISLINRPRSPRMSFAAEADRSRAGFDLRRVLDARVRRIAHAPASLMIHLLYSLGSRHRQASKTTLGGR
jgi:hypothetical protein